MKDSFTAPNSHDDQIAASEGGFQPTDADVVANLSPEPRSAAHRDEMLRKALALECFGCTYDDAGRLIGSSEECVLHGSGYHDGPLISALDALVGERDRARVLARNLFPMIDRETWREHGGGTFQGVSEGEYRASQIEEEIKSWEQ